MSKLILGFAIFFAIIFNIQFKIEDYTDSKTVSEILRRMLIPGILLICLLLLYVKFNKLTRAEKMLSKFPGPRPLALIGNIHQFAEGRYLETYFSFIRKYGRRLVYRIGRVPVVYLVEAKSVEKVLSSSVHLGKGKIYDLSLKWLIGDGLVTSDIKTWKVDRKLMNPFFKYQRFDGFLDSFNKHGRTFVENATNDLGNGPKNLHPVLAMCTMDSILESVLGVKSDFQRNPSDVVKHFDSTLIYIRHRVLKPWLVFPVIWNIFGYGLEEIVVLQNLKNFINDIRKKRNMLEETNEVLNEITKPLIEVLSDRSDQNIFEHIMTVFSAGYETTASGMNYCLYLLALHPEHQDKIQEELDQVLGTEDKIELSFSNVAEIKYLERCILESMRLLPPVPFMFRVMESDLELDDGLIIPGGTNVHIDIYDLHRDPSVFPDPEKFDPNRFLPENCIKRSVYSYLPFSIGPRSCIGKKYAMMQMKVVLSYILKNFSVSTTLKIEDLKPLPGLVLEPNVPIPLQFTKRK